MLDLKAIRKKTTRFGIGLMSGSSCDGVDAVLVRLKGHGKNLVIKLVAHETLPYDAEFRKRLMEAHLDAQEICYLNTEMGERLAQAAKTMQDIAKKEQIDVDYVASHGHTIAHHPPPARNGVGTLQIGESAIIAERTKLPVVSDFRPRDMAVGGQGAPLVPYADWVLFHRLEHPVVCLNIGGFANFTVVAPDIDDVIAFDTGPGNILIDGAVRLLTRGQKSIDEDGEAAAQGVVIDEFLDYLLDHPFYDQEPPKSTGRETFGADVFLRDALANRKEHSYVDLITTVTSAVARSIADAYENFIAPEYENDRIIVSGGGAKNKTLMRLLRALLHEKDIYTSDQYGLPGDAREALAFAILGNETLCGKPSNIPPATGALNHVILGKITPP